MNHWLALSLAIVAEVIATSTMKSTQEFTRFWPSVVVVLGYGAGFYFMAISMRVLPVGIMYAIWAGMGIVLVSIIGWIVYQQALDLAAMIGIALIIAGVIVINVFSKTVGH
jgi:small multidrug resistance pump